MILLISKSLTLLSNGIIVIIGSIIDSIDDSIDDGIIIGIVQSDIILILLMMEMK